MSKSQNPSFDEFLLEAHNLADLAGARILPYFRKAMQVVNKQQGRGFDPVTEADKAAERVMRQSLRKRFPDHAIVGEEYEAHETSSRYRWVLDPIDGTRAFICGFPLWGVLIGVLDGERPIVGVMDQPYTRERFWSAERQTIMRNANGTTRVLKTRACAKLSEAVLVATAPDMFRSTAEKAAFARISTAARMTRFGGDCYAYCMLAAGQLDLIVEAGLKQVDIVALIPIIERAGGRITTWEGGSAIQGGRIVAAGDPRIHEAALNMLAKR